MILAQVKETYQNEDQSWLGSAHGTDAARSITLKASAFTAQTHYPDGYLPSGMALGQITASGLFGPYDDGATDGRENFAGFLLCSVKFDGVNDVVAALLDHGRVIVSRLPSGTEVPDPADAPSFVFV